MPGSGGGISHIFESTKSRKSHKLGHKKHGVGFEAPRNSLDISISTSRVYRHYSTNDIPVKHRSSKMNYGLNGTSMKRFIDGEISRRSSESHAAPSVVARLMGMDSMPLEPKEHEIDQGRRSMEISKPRKSDSTLVTSRSSTSSRHSKQNLFLNADRRDHKTERTRKSQPRKHPQEEVLQKFKKEFEAWQASKLWEHPVPHKNHILPRDGKDYHTLAQEALNKEKMAKYMDNENNLAETKEVSSSKQSGDTQQVSSSLQGHDEHSSKPREFSWNSSSSMTIKLGIGANDPECLPGSKADRKQERSCSRTRIVILKPNFDKVDCDEELFTAASSDKFGKECSMEDFLEEVKERLRNEVQGKNGNNAKPRGCVEGTSFSEKSIDPKQIARDIARHIRESVTKDRGTRLMRSESTRSVRSDIQMNAPDSPEFIRRDTRKLLSEKSKNVLKNKIFLKQLIVNHGDSGSSSLIKGKEVTNSMSDFSNKGKNVENWKDKNGASESILGQSKKIVSLDADSVSQINLIRSFSAPVSGTSFGKLLLEDQHVAGAHICRKHEASEHNFSEVRKWRSDSFNLKGTVSNLRHNLNLKSKLFGRKTRPIEEPIASEFKSMKEIQTAPAVINNSGISQENSTEVPPSPASVSGSSPDEFCRQDIPSPISPLEVMEYHTSPCISEELNCNAPEPVLSEHVEHGETKMAVEEQPPHKEETTEIKSGDTAYLHDLLVTAGFYEDKSIDQANSKLDALTRPISRQVFDEVEKAYGKHGQEEEVDDESSIIHNDDIAIGSKLLFDLVNEALQSVLGPKINCSMFKRWIMGHAASPQGKNLLDDLWSQIQSYTNPSLGECGTLDRRMAQELKMTTWPTMLYEDIDVVGRQIERVILHNLISDIIRDLCSWNH